MRSGSPAVRTGEEADTARREVRLDAWRRNPGVRVGTLTTALAVTATAVQVGWLYGGDAPLGPLTVRLLVVAVLFALAEKFVVTFPVRRGSHTISLSEIPLVLGLVAIHPVLLVVARLAGAVVGLTAFRRQRGSKLAFNLALYATQATVASVVFHLLVRSSDPLGPVGWAATFAATFVTDVVSIVLVTAVIAIHDDSEEWRRLVTADIRNLFQLPLVAVTTALALVTALVVRDQAPAAVLIGVLCFAVYRAFRRYAQQTQGHSQVEELYAFTRALDGSHDIREVVQLVLSRVRDLVRAQSAEFVVAGAAGRTRMRIRLSGQDHVDTDTDAEPPDGTWWQPAGDGTPVLRPLATQHVAGTDQADGMAVPVALHNATGVLIVTESLPDIPTFTGDHLRLMQALAAHAGVALTNLQLVDQLRHASLHDALTDLPNRRQFLDDTQRATEAISTSPHVVGILLMDLDRFKEINDALGHDVGDDLLREIGQRLHTEFGGRGTVARLGGDEFAMVVPGASSRQEVLAVADELRRTVERPVPVGGLTMTVQPSIGVCLAPDHGLDADRLLRRADVAMYAAKQARAGIRVYQPEDDQNTTRRLVLMADLRAAIDGRALEVVYQPKVDPRSGRVLGAEALTRWHHIDGTVPPDEFIPLAERSGLIRPLTRHVLDTALGSCAGWRTAGHDVCVAVNLSPHLLADRTLIDEVRQALQMHRLPAAALTLEITENGIMENQTSSHLTLASLHQLGVKLSIDDFGTGHSSLGRLAELPIHEMKIDKSFIRNLARNPSARAVTDVSLQLGRTLNLVVVAEGVESHAELEYLAQRGCDAIQGYHISRPLSAGNFMTWLTDRSEPANSAALRERHEVAHRELAIRRDR